MRRGTFYLRRYLPSAVEVTEVAAPGETVYVDLGDGGYLGLRLTSTGLEVTGVGERMSDVIQVAPRAANVVEIRVGR